MNTEYEGLTAKQKDYYAERVAFISGMGIAIPFGMIREKALSMTDADIDKWFENLTSNTTSNE